MLERFASELRRVGWALGGAALAAVYIARAGREVFEQQVGVLAWKIILLGVAVFFAHSIRKQLFPYIDMSAHAASDGGNSGRVFLAMAILYSAIILAFLAGL